MSKRSIEVEFNSDNKPIRFFSSGRNAGRTYAHKWRKVKQFLTENPHILDQVIKFEI